MKRRILRATTVPQSLHLLLRGQLEYMQANGYEILTVSADGPEVAHLAQKGIPHQAVRMTRKITPLRDLVALIQLVRIIKAFKPDIVHTHTPKAGLLGMIAAWICRIQVRMHTVAGLPLMEASGVKRMILMITERLTYMFATSVHPNSSGLEDFMRQNFASYSGKMAIIGKGSSNGIDVDYFNADSSLRELAKNIRERHAVDDGAIVFSFVGRIVRDKGIVELVNAFRNLRQSGENFYLLLVGQFEEHLDPIPKDELEFLTSDSRVILAGFQQDVRPWLMASDVFVFPSYREGFPNVVMQACCMQIPCIVSDINGCNEIIHDGKTGVIVPPKQTEPLSNAMLRLSNDSEFRKKIRIAAREDVVKNYDQRYLWDAIRSVYDKTIV